MGTLYSNNLTLKDIFTDKKLRGKIPLITVQDKPNGATRTSTRSVNRIIYDKSVAIARPFYKSFSPSRLANNIYIDGKTDVELDAIVNAVYIGLTSIKSNISYVANNSSVLQSAIKESERNKSKFGIDTKLYLRANSLEQIENMGKRELNTVLNDIIKNIYFGDNFPETQKKFGLDKAFIQGKSYKERVRDWKRSIGEL